MVNLPVTRKGVGSACANTYHTFTEDRREITDSVVALRPVSESSGERLLSITPLLLLLSLSSFSLQNLLSSAPPLFRIYIPTQKVDNALVILQNRECP
ncbi:hypothetical protein EVAR_48851_1 [Eumeta japonica]|uniref:Uncharacterized protein n=1 Tax=Eumeta variegata TaxID=151549 RepID=A0A4C1YEH9_EUMVA|nr:hypothetical protein EVAR_48851_1 [Eumeta japonica]